MEIAINGRLLPIECGSSVYVRNLLAGFARLDPANTYHVFSPVDPGIPPFGHNVRIITARSKVFREQNLREQFYWEQYFFPRTGAKVGASLLHSPYLGGAYFHRRPQVVSALDIIPYRLPEYLPQSFHEECYFKLQELVLKKTDRIITISEFSKQDIVNTFSIPADKIRVTYLAPDPAFRKVEDRDPIEKLKSKYSLAKPYVLYVGGTDPRKNLETLLAGYAQLSQDIKQTHDLVLLGQFNKIERFQPYHASLLGLIHQESMIDKVRMIPHAPLEELVLLYNAASVFVYPSRYEGFGLPPLEAMACGTPVVAAAATCIPEVVGDAALLFDPSSPEQLTAAITRVIEEPDVRDSLSTKGATHARTFNWDKTARETIAIYQELAS